MTGDTESLSLFISLGATAFGALLSLLYAATLKRVSDLDKKIEKLEDKRFYELEAAFNAVKNEHSNKLTYLNSVSDLHKAEIANLKVNILTKDEFDKATKYQNRELEAIKEDQKEVKQDVKRLGGYRTNTPSPDKR